MTKIIKELKNTKKLLLIGYKGKKQYRLIDPNHIVDVVFNKEKKKIVFKLINKSKIILKNQTEERMDSMFNEIIRLMDK